MKYGASGELELGLSLAMEPGSFTERITRFFVDPENSESSEKFAAVQKSYISSQASTSSAPYHVPIDTSSQATVDVTF
jgi:hypothetical protein